MGLKEAQDSRPYILFAEDKNFFSHPGIDAKSITRAIIKNLKNIFLEKRLEGASTITQQVAKNFLLTKENIIANKAASQAITHFGKIPLFIYFFNVNYFSELNTLLPLMMAVFIGTNIGKKILVYIPENIFKILFKTALTIIALRLIIMNFI